MKILYLDIAVHILKKLKYHLAMELLLS